MERANPILNQALTATPTKLPAEAAESASQSPVPADAVASVAGAGDRAADIPTAWLDTSCELLTEWLPWLLPREECNGLYVNLLAGFVLAGVLGVVGWLARVAWRMLAGRRRTAGDADPHEAPSPTVGTRDAPSAAVQTPALAPSSTGLPGLASPDALARMRDLLLGLPRWGDARVRQGFVTLALGKGHRALEDIDWGGGARDVAWSVVSVCDDFGGATMSAHEPRAPLCLLLAAIPREFGGDPRRDAEIDALRHALGCG